MIECVVPAGSLQRCISFFFIYFFGPLILKLQNLSLHFPLTNSFLHSRLKTHRVWKPRRVKTISGLTSTCGVCHFWKALWVNLRSTKNTPGFWSYVVVSHAQNIRSGHTFRHAGWATDGTTDTLCANCCRGFFATPTNICCRRAEQHSWFPCRCAPPTLLWVTDCISKACSSWTVH